MMQHCTFSPTITKYLPESESNVQEEYWERLYASHSVAEARKQMLREDLDRKERELCSFHPKINAEIPFSSQNNGDNNNNNAYYNNNNKPSSTYVERMKLFSPPERSDASDMPSESLEYDSVENVSLSYARRNEQDDHHMHYASPTHSQTRSSSPKKKKKASKKKRSKRKAILYVDIRLSNSQMARLAIYDAKSCQRTVEEFAARHGLDPVHADALHSMVVQRLSCL